MRSKVVAEGSLSEEEIMSVREYLLNGPLGIGAAPLGNMFRSIPDSEAEATVDAAWQQGSRYYDTAPFYGAGLSEMRLGKALAKHKRDEYRLSTKVGRLILDEIDHEIRNFGEKGDLFPLLIHQPSYSMLNRHIETGLLSVLEDLGVGCIGFSALAQGLLTNKYISGKAES